MQTVKICTKEIESGLMKPEHNDTAIRALQDNGVVRIQGAVDIEHIDRLGEKMLNDIRVLEQSKGAVSNWQGIRPPPFQPYLFKDVLYNEMAISVALPLLGKGLILDSYGANTAFPGKAQQGVHADTQHLWPNLEIVPPPHCIVVNIPLVDVDECNGATKVWPGTHKDTRIHGDRSQPTTEMISEWEEKHPAERIFARKGDLVLRDMRVWHCGMPNSTYTPRPMLAIIYRCQWSPLSGFEAERGCENFFEHPILQNSAVFLDAPIDYMHQGHSQPFRPLF